MGRGNADDGGGRGALAFQKNPGAVCRNAAGQLISWSRGNVRRTGGNWNIMVNGNFGTVLERMKLLAPEEVTMEALTLEEIFVTALK